MNTQIMTANEAGLQPSLGLHIQTPTTSKTRLWTGFVISGALALLLLSGGINTARQASFVMDGFAHLGYPVSAAFGMGIVQFVCALLFLIPRTSFLGALLLTAYFGGATASHVRISEPFFPPVIAGVLVWVALVLRDDRLRALISPGKTAGPVKDSLDR